MPYDEDLANRIRAALADEVAISEKKMFGGLAFLIGGHMTVAASRGGGMLVRLHPAETDDALAQPHVELMSMRGRVMEGWMNVAPEGLASDAELDAWIRRSLRYVRTLPPK
jgi:hypothetical protein